jgi:hypothetical protein
MLLTGQVLEATSRRLCNAKRRVVEARHVQRSAAVGRGRSDLHGFNINALVGSFPILKYQLEVLQVSLFGGFPKTRISITRSPRWF